MTKIAWYHAEMNIPWDDLHVFLAVAEAGSLSAAARRLRMTQPTVSRRVAELEATVGEPLFVRAVDGASLTSFGERLLEPAKRMAEWAAEVERAAERAESTPRGVVRLAAPPGVAFELGAPFATWLRDKLPEVRLELLAGVQYLDLSRRDADLAIRMAAPVQRDVVTLATVEVEVAPFAAERYARTLPRHYGISDVAWIGWAPPFDHLPPNSLLTARIPGWAPVFASDDYLVQLRAAEAGMGAMFLGRSRHRFSMPTSLVELDLDVGDLRSTIYLVCAKSALAIPRVRAVAELLTAELEKTEAPKRRRPASPQTRKR
ncbi:Transcriptional regulator, LysR family protein [Minicystis rosea]|nr:Transcriptional regulator, LysR family protein [Minicystis rosea]